MSSAKKRAPLCAFLAFLIAWLGGAESRGTAPPGSPVRTRQELAQKILKVDNLFAAEFDKEHAAGLTVAVVSGPELVWTKSYGLADVESESKPTPGRSIESVQLPSSSLL